MRGFPLFKIFGIKILAHPSWIFIFLLVTWSLSQGVFRTWHPDWQMSLRWTVALCASLIFFFSVLLHELAHSLVAKAYHIPVKRITLFLFGGVSNIEREPASPKVEFLIAIVGPITSIALGLFFSVLAVWNSGLSSRAMENPMEMFSRLNPVSTLLTWLGSINVVVGMFNLIPGFPLDGGRILRSALWAGTKNFRKATLWASTVGQSVGWLMIMMGILMVFGAQIPFFGSGVVNGIWLAAIGWFLNSAAADSNQKAIIQELLGDVPVSRLMRSDVPVISPDASVESLVTDWILGTDERSFPVLEGDKMVGLVCLADVRKVPRSEWNFTKVKDIMTPAEKITSVVPDQDLSDVLKSLMSHDVRQVPVVENGHLIGMLRRRDIVRWLQIHSELYGSDQAR